MFDNNEVKNSKAVIFISLLLVLLKLQNILQTVLALFYSII
jgi:hypothetical protein